MDTSSLDRRLIHSQLRQVRTSLRRLTELAGLAPEAFVTEPDHFAIAEHHLRRAIEAAMDVGRHMIARLGLGEADRYSDIPRLLGEHGILAPETVVGVHRLARVRNRLVRLYWQVGAEEMHSLLPTCLGALERACEDIAAFLADMGS